MKTLEFTMHTDPAHGWLKTDMKTVRQYGVQGLISDYSYRDGDTVYLEEDCDATLLLKAIEDLGDVAAFKTDRHTDEPSWIRELPPYHWGENDN